VSLHLSLSSARSNRLRRSFRLAVGLLVAPAAVFAASLSSAAPVKASRPSPAFSAQSCGSYRTTVEADSPSAYWGLGEAAGSSDAFDSSGNGNTGAYSGGTGLGASGAIAGDSDTALNLNGSTGYMQAPTSTSLNSPTSGLTLEAWVKPPSSSASAFSSQRPVMLKSFTSHSPPYYQYGIFLWDSTSNPKDVSVVYAINGTYTRADFTGTGWTYDAWSHLVVTWNGSTLTLYRNGASVGTRSQAGTISTYATPIDLGAYANLAKNSSYLFPGQIDEVAVYNHALSAASVQGHYSAGTGGAGGSNCAPASTTPPSVSGSAQQGSSLTADPGTWSGSPTSFAYQWQSCGGYSAAVGADSPTAYWRLGEAAGSSTALDSSGNGKNGTYSGGTGLGAAGAVGGSDTALNLDGSSGYMEAPSSATLNSPSTGLTLEAWVKPPSASSSAFSSQRPVVLKSFTSHSNPYYQYGIFLWDDTSHPKDVSVVLAVGGSYVRYDFAGTGWTYDAWNHLVVTWDGSTVTLYRNGATVVTMSQSGSISSYATPIDIGAYANLAKNSSYLFPGQIDEVAVYNHTLTAARVQAHYSATGGNCTDIGGATTSGYTVAPADVGATLRVKVTATNDFGSGTAYSAPTGVVQGPPVPANTTPPSVAGALEDGAVLSADPGVWTGEPTSYAYQWQTCTDPGACSDLAGATASSYTVLDDDINATLRVTVEASNASGSGAASSSATGHIRIPHYSHSSDQCSTSDIEDPANLLVDYPRVIYTFIPVVGPPFYDYEYTSGPTGGKAAAAIAQEHWNGGAGSNSSYYDYGSNGGCVNQDTYATTSYLSGHHVRFWISSIGRRPVGAAHHDFECGFGHSSDQWIESAEDLANFIYNYTDFNSYQPHPTWAVYQDRPYTITDKCGHEVPDDGLTQELDFRNSNILHITGSGGGGLP
jgi:hypothetical protein